MILSVAEPSRSELCLCAGPHASCSAWHRLLFVLTRIAKLMNRFVAWGDPLAERGQRTDNPTMGVNLKKIEGRSSITNSPFCGLLVCACAADAARQIPC
jgi:hypothetical protein